MFVTNQQNAYFNAILHQHVCLIYKTPWMVFTTIRIKVIPITEQINQKLECLIGLSLFLFTTQTPAQQGSQHQSIGPGVCAFLCGALQECHYLSCIGTLFIFSSVFNTVNRDMFLKLDIVSSSSEGLKV